MNLTQSQLQSLVRFDEDLGVFYSIVPFGRWGKYPAGTLLSKPGASRDGLRSRTFVPEVGRFLTHRVVWFYKTGRWPVEQIDHIDRNPMNNRFSNLREATNGLNQQNCGTPKNNKLGIRGICYKPSRGRKCYQAGLAINGTAFRGFFETLEEAVEYRRDLERRYYTFL